MTQPDQASVEALLKSLTQSQQKLFEATELFDSGEALEFDQKLRRRYTNLRSQVHELEVRVENLARDIQKKL